MFGREEDEIQEEVNQSAQQLIYNALCLAMIKGSVDPEQATTQEIKAVLDDLKEIDNNVEKMVRKWFNKFNQHAFGTLMTITLSAKGISDYNLSRMEFAAFKILCDKHHIAFSFKDKLTFMKVSMPFKSCKALMQHADELKEIYETQKKEAQERADKENQRDQFMRIKMEDFSSRVFSRKVLFNLHDNNNTVTYQLNHSEFAALKAFLDENKISFRFDYIRSDLTKFIIPDGYEFLLKNEDALKMKLEAQKQLGSTSATHSDTTSSSPVSAPNEITSLSVNEFKKDKKAYQKKKSLQEHKTDEIREKLELKRQQKETNKQQGRERKIKKAKHAENQSIATDDLTKVESDPKQEVKSEMQDVVDTYEDSTMKTTTTQTTFNDSADMRMFGHAISKDKEEDDIEARYKSMVTVSKPAPKKSESLSYQQVKFILAAKDHYFSLESILNDLQKATEANESMIYLEALHHHLIRFFLILSKYPQENKQLPLGVNEEMAWEVRNMIIHGSFQNEYEQNKLIKLASEVVQECESYFVTAKRIHQKEDEKGYLNILNSPLYKTLYTRLKAANLYNSKEMNFDRILQEVEKLIAILAFKVKSEVGNPKVAFSQNAYHTFSAAKMCITSLGEVWSKLSTNRYGISSEFIACLNECTSDRNKIAHEISAEKAATEVDPNHIYSLGQSLIKEYNKYKLSIMRISSQQNSLFSQSTSARSKWKVSAPEFIPSQMAPQDTLQPVPQPTQTRWIIPAVEYIPKTAENGEDPKSGQTSSQVGQRLFAPAGSETKTQTDLTEKQKNEFKSKNY